MNDDRQKPAKPADKAKRAIAEAIFHFEAETGLKVVGIGITWQDEEDTGGSPFGTGVTVSLKTE